MLDKIKYLGHASILIEDICGKIIYIDPWKIKDNSIKADIILVTHPHFDHFSEEDIKKISNDKTVLYSCREVIEKTSLKNKYVIKPFEEVKMDLLIIKGFPSYNINENFHPKENQYLGFIIKCNNFSIYIAGDTDLIEEAKKLDVNLMILPIGGTYTMDFREAAELVNTAKPNYVIPYHYGDIVGSEKDAINFKSLVKYSEVIIKK
jgi:L-ascorbate metabolism protein UlaG (beta-lactamase superfamily)